MRAVVGVLDRGLGGLVVRRRGHTRQSGAYRVSPRAPGEILDLLEVAVDEGEIKPPPRSGQVGDRVDLAVLVIGKLDSVTVPILHLPKLARVVEDDLIADLVFPGAPARLGSVGLKRTVERFGCDVAAASVGHERQSLALAGKPDLGAGLRVVAVLQPVAIRERPALSQAGVVRRPRVVVTGELEREPHPGEAQVCLVMVDAPRGDVDRIAHDALGGKHLGDGVHDVECHEVVGRYPSVVSSPDQVRNDKPVGSLFGRAETCTVVVPEDGRLVGDPHVPSLLHEIVVDPVGEAGIVIVLQSAGIAKRGNEQDRVFLILAGQLERLDGRERLPIG